MTKKIRSLNQFKMALNTMARGAEEQIRKAIFEAVVRVADDAIKQFGTYQPQIGPFQAWQNLHPYTLKQKYKAGAMKDDPLIGHYPSGKRNKVWVAHLVNSIKYEAHALYGTVGTNDPLGKWHEFGTDRIPARPFLRPALYKNREWIRERLKEAIAIALRQTY